LIMKKYSWVVYVVAMAAVYLMLFLVSCRGPKTYEFQYSVDVRYNDGTRETLVGANAQEVDDPKKVVFQINTILRSKGCLSLGPASGCIATDVRSFTVNVLKYVEVKNVK